MATKQISYADATKQIQSEKTINQKTQILPPPPSQNKHININDADERIEENKTLINISVQNILENITIDNKEDTAQQITELITTIIGIVIKTLENKYKNG